jgi:hypothetical protein
MEFYFDQDSILWPIAQESGTLAHDLNSILLFTWTKYINIRFVKYQLRVAWLKQWMFCFMNSFLENYE